ncbi:uncharacterized protein LOC107045003 [Diachasma alloeum]|uniref:uncharacterized protein LOC107045003 n=1 Tax=Diachasma alloeum TaxID=454923 RepID=UPI0007382A91|nr:uncharacterized protein LOC107045003 [Diachasma alloeum]
MSLWIRQWMDLVGLTLAEHKTEAVLITSQQNVETITLHVGNYEITSQPSLRYLQVMIDTRLSFKQQVEYVGAKASGVGTVLSWLMPYIGGPKQKRRTLLSSVVMSVLIYGISIWAHVLLIQYARRKVASVNRLSALGVASAFCRVSEDAVCVIAGMLPIGILAEERRCLYLRKRLTTQSAAELRTDERDKSLHRWQLL